ncbi:MAG: hypothetical protein ACE5LH_06140 [Fidelibacterota bacterium]
MTNLKNALVFTSEPPDDETGRNLRMEPVRQRKPLKVIHEDFTNRVSFNVMPDLSVEETLFIKEYRIWDRYIEAVFDRKYSSAMAKSPDHFMFITALVHLQKMLYVYLCHEFDIPYRPTERERIKIWPTVLSLDMPRLVTESTDIVHRLRITDVFQRNAKSYYVSGDSIIENTVRIQGEAVVYLI